MEPLTVLISRSVKDTDADSLEMHLSVLQNKGEILVKNTAKLPPGSAIDPTVQALIDTADILVPMLTAGYLAAETAQMDRIRKRETGDKFSAIVIPVRLGPIEQSPFSQAHYPQNGKAIRKCPSRDEAYSEVTRAIAEAAAILRRDGRGPNIPHEKSDTPPRPNALWKRTLGIAGDSKTQFQTYQNWFFGLGIVLCVVAVIILGNAPPPEPPTWAFQLGRYMLALGGSVLITAGAAQLRMERPLLTAALSFIGFMILSRQIATAVQRLAHYGDEPPHVVLPPPPSSLPPPAAPPAGSDVPATARSSPPASSTSPPPASSSSPTAQVPATQPSTTSSETQTAATASSSSSARLTTTDKLPSGVFSTRGSISAGRGRQYNSDPTPDAGE